MHVQTASHEVQADVLADGSQQKSKSTQHISVSTLEVCQSCLNTLTSLEAEEQ